MAARHLLARTAGGTWAAALAISLIDRRLALDAGVEPPLHDGPLVSIVVPARDEQRDIATTVRSHLAQDYRALELIVVDDQSHDGTAQAAIAAAGGDPRFRLIVGTAPPDGWVGKSWACQQGADAARGSWLLFSDADVEHAPDALGRCLAMALRLDRGGLTLAPRVQTAGHAERVVMPVAIQLIQTMVAPALLARMRHSPITMAAGAYMLMRRDVYDAAGGHAGIGHDMVDDLSLGRAIKRQGSLLVPANGTRLVRLRMYHGAGEMWRGWRKNAAFARPRARTRGLAPAVLLATLGPAPVVALVAGARRGDRGLLAAGAAGFAAQLALQRTAAPVVTTPVAYAPTFPLGTLFIAAAAARGAIDRISGRGPLWRGRRYPHAAGRPPRER